MTGAWPGSVVMLALLRWSPSGKFGADGAPLAPSSVLTLTAAAPVKASNPIGAAARWSWKRLTDQKTWTAFCSRFARQLPGLAPFHEHLWAASHAPSGLSSGATSLNGYGPPAGSTSSGPDGTSSSSKSLHVCANGPLSVVPFAGSVRY